jgi:cysteine-rich repeat protein
VCIATGCGNGTVEPPEECDDGNQVGGDGCAANCSKLETCGDGVVDEGELCDDANDNPADGCDACVAMTWSANAVVGGSALPTSVGLWEPWDVAVDRNGATYIADATNNRIRRVDAGGAITTVAGTGVPGFSGDGGQATSAELSFPIGVAVDGLGNLYISDYNNLRIRRVTTDGIITTIAGTGTGGFNGDGIPATTARLDNPGGIAVDGLGNVYVADSSNHRVRKIATNGIITTSAGTGTPGYSGDDIPATTARLWFPTDVELDSAGRLYIADKNNQRVRRVATSGEIATVAGTGVQGSTGDGSPATSATLDRPSYVAVDATGNLYINDYSFTVRRVDGAGIIDTVAGNGNYGFGGDGGAATSPPLR